jgi:glucose-6-phosphate-specific signal transduction histidine kinase
MNIASFILKVLLLSTGLSLGIKYLAPSLNIPATSANALIAVFLPTVVMAIVLGWQSWREKGD